MLAIVAFASCEAPFGNRVCTLIGCDSGYQLLVGVEDDPTALGKYTIVLTHDEQQFACTFELVETGDSCETKDCIENRVCNPLNRVYYSSADEKLYLFFPHLDGELNVSIEQNGKQLLEMKTTPFYEESHPNGPDCGPTCYNAKSEIVLSR